MSQASAQAFDTAELLEMILLSLPMRDLLFAQAVCRQWNELIGWSVKLQQALFIRPATNTTAKFNWERKPDSYARLMNGTEAFPSTGFWTGSDQDSRRVYLDLLPKHLRSKTLQAWRSDGAIDY